MSSAQILAEYLPRIAEALETLAKQGAKPAPAPLSDTAYAVDVARPAFEKGERLQAWAALSGVPGVPFTPAEHVLNDAIRQATKPETIEWLAAIAERYGFKP